MYYSCRAQAQKVHLADKASALYAAVSPCGQVGLIQHILVRCLVVVHKVAVGHVGQVLTVAVLAVVRRYHTICDEVWQERCTCSSANLYLVKWKHNTRICTSGVYHTICDKGRAGMRCSSMHVQYE